MDRNEVYLKHQRNRKAVSLVKKIAILGAGYFQEPLIIKAKEMGLQVHCFSWLKDAVCKNLADKFYPISITEKEKILMICKDNNIDGIISIASDIAMTTVSYVAQNLNLISNTQEATSISRNKGLTRQCLEKNGLNTPNYWLGTDFTLFDNTIDYPLIVKPSDSSGSRGITKVFGKEGLSVAFDWAKSFSLNKKVIIESYIEGDEVSVETLSYKGNHQVIVVTDKVTTGSPHFVELEHHQPSNLSSNILKSIEIETINALKSIGITNGSSHIEAKINSNGEVFIIEIGSRMGGDFIGSHLVENSTGVDYLKQTIDIAIDNFDSFPKVTKKAFTGIYFISNETKHLYKYFNDDYDFILEKNFFNKEFKNLKNSNDRSGYLIYNSYKKIDLNKSDE